MSGENPNSPTSIARRGSWRLRGSNQTPPTVLSRAPPPVAQRHRRLPLQSGESDDKPQSGPLTHQVRGASSVSSLVNSLNMSNSADHASSSLSSVPSATSRLGGYRLSSLDRLAQRQRLFEQTQNPIAPGGVAATTASASAVTTSTSSTTVLASISTSYTAAPSSLAALQSKRDLFFKSENDKGAGASTAPVPVPASVTSPVTTNGTPAGNTGPAPISSSGAIASLKESLLASTKELNPPPQAPVTVSSTSKVEALKRELVEDNRERERVRERDKLAPAPPPPGGGSVEVRRTREVDYVGFANLPNQVYRRAVKRGFEFTLMVVGESGLGKSTLINSMFLADIYSPEYPGPSHRLKKTVQVEQCKVLLRENGVNLTLNVVDTPGFGDAVDNSNCWQPVIDFVESKYEEYLNAESRVQRKQISDSRVHCCLYFIAPGHGLKPLDVEFMKRLHDKVNIIPVIAKADTMTPEECVHFKRQVLNEIAQNKIKIYEFPEPDEEELRKEQKALRERVPFAVVGSNAVVEVDGRKLRGRRYPWGVVEVENLEHCDFIPLRNMVIRTHMNDLKEVTNNVHYENYRCRKLAGVNTNDGKSNRISNKNPLAQMEEERKEHEAKMKKMEAEMEQVFEMKVKEKTQKLKDSESDLQRRHEQMRKSLEMQAAELEEKRKALEAERENWEAANGITILELRQKDLEANSKEQVDGKEKTKKKKGLF